MTTHPLDPLSAAEIRTAAATVKRDERWTPRWRIVFVLPYEPAKPELRAWERGEGPRPARTALVVVRDKGERRTLELVVDLEREAIVASREPQGVQPAVMREESVAVERMLREHPDWQAALRRRGVEDFSLALIDHMPLGYQDAADGPQQRRGIALTWMRDAGAADGDQMEDNGYARPVEGLIAHFDLDAMAVLRVEDHGGAPIPGTPGNYTLAGVRDPANVSHHPDAPRTTVRALEIAQPEGPSFTVDGWQVRWQGWELRVGFNAREGLVLHDVAYVDRGRRRPILHRASLSEMFVPYADPGVTHFRKQLFDQGESGIGRCVNSLRLGCDCLGHIHYFDGVIHDNDGEPIDLPNAVCMHEEDYGLLWKHTNLRTGRPESRRSRRLVVSSFTTVGNYDYGFFWYLYQDGTIEHEVKLTGILSTGAYAPGDDPRFGTPLAPGLYGPNHQHWFNVRLDMAVDGDRNRLVEVNSRPVEDDALNFFGGAWTAEATVLRSELEAQRDLDLRTARYWRVANAESVNAMGQHASYALLPGHNAFHLYREDAPALQRAAFIRHHLWATRYDRDELYAAGDHPNQHPGGAGLPAWTARDAALEDKDVVVWYSFVAHHITRPEDWPVMPAAYAGFQLRPFAFFDGNPALDLPAEAPSCHA